MTHTSSKKEELRNILRHFTDDKEWAKTKVENHPEYTVHQNECKVCNKMRQLEDNAIISIKSIIKTEVAQALKELKEELPDTTLHGSSIRVKQNIRDGGYIDGVVDCRRAIDKRIEELKEGHKNGG